MTVTTQTISSVIEMVDIDEVKNHQKNILDSSFNTDEWEELEKRHIRSTAGVLALKKALCTLTRKITGKTLNKKDFLISRLASGAPVLQSLPDQVCHLSYQHKNIFLSISHSKQTAYGLAVYQEEASE